MRKDQIALQLYTLREASKQDFIATLRKVAELGYRAVEPAPNHGLNRFAPNHRCPVGAKIEQVLQGVFAKAQAGMEAELARVTLADVEGQLHAVCPTAGKRSA